MDTFWTIQYKPGYYISGNSSGPQCRACYSPNGTGYEWQALCVSAHAAKLAISKHIKENSK